MSDHSIYFQASGGGLTLTNAILLYRNDTTAYEGGSGHSVWGARAFASIHRVDLDGEGRPTIAAGTPLSRAHLRQWSEALGKSLVPELLPEAVLVAHPDILAWWSPAGVRPAYFSLSDPPPGLRALSKRTIVPVPYPAHLFVGTRANLGVYALPANARPTARTPLRHSPILNVFLNGNLCWGSIPRPKSLSVESIPEFERAVFDSWSTHPNPGQELTITGGGLVRLWDDLAARGAKRFPVRRLKPFVARAEAVPRGSPGRGADAMTVGRLIAECARQ